MTVHRLIDTRGRPVSSKPRAEPIKRANDHQREIVDTNAHSVTLTALVLALAKQFVVATDDATAAEFIGYFNDQSRKMAAQLGHPAIATAAEEKTSQLAGMLLAKRAEAKRDGIGG
jgi:nucleoside 2-deoxyribosyltransferase